MPPYGSDLAHTLGEVPELLLTCLTTWKSRGLGVRELRLVSKEIGSAALQAVQSCTLKLGEGVYPDPHQMAQLMRNTCLIEVNLTILVVTGSTAASSEQQLAACMSQARCILTAMQAALRRVTHLHVAVHHTHHLSSAESAAVCDSEAVISETGKTEMQIFFAKPWLYPEPVPDSLEAVASAVFDLLAPAMPHLQKLSVSKGCAAAAIRAFGQRCPQLNSLEVDVHTVPAAALHSISKHLRGMTHLALCGKWQCGFKVCPYLQEALGHLQPCAVLASLEVCVNAGRCGWSCNQEAWELFPTSLQEYRGIVIYLSSEVAATFCGQLKRVSAVGSINTSLNEFLRRYPLLQELVLLGNGEAKLLLCADDYVRYAGGSRREEASFLKGRFEAGFKLSCRHMQIKGSSAAVREALEWLPSFPSTTGCRVHMTGSSHDTCLQNIARVFPKLETFFVSDDSKWRDRGNGIEADFFAPLAACASLQSFESVVHVKFTSKWCFQLCQKLPDLTSFKYVECEGVDLCLLQEAIPLLLEREIQIQEHARGVFYGEPGDGSEEDEDN